VHTVEKSKKQPPAYGKLEVIVMGRRGDSGKKKTITKTSKKRNAPKPAKPIIAPETKAA